MTEEFAPNMVEEAIRIMTAENSVSVALLQRHLRLGYGMALKLMDPLEQNGAVTPLNEVGIRTLKSPSYALRSKGAGPGNNKG